MQHGFLQSGGAFTSIDFPGAVATLALQQNSPAGDITGRYVDATGMSHGWLLTRGNFTSFDFPGAILTGASGINPEGDITGGYMDRSGRLHGFLLSRKK